MNPGNALCGMVAFIASFPLLAGEPPKWIMEGPYLDEKPASVELPLQAFGNMLIVEIKVGGEPRRFLFDTGSPSMMNAKLAEELGLEVVDKRQGKDSHGAIIETEVVQADLALGGTTIRKVPVFVADFPKPAQCLFDGVLGSEVLPLGSWQIDLPESVIRFSTNPAELDHLEPAKKQSLYDFGYPHAPILDVRFAEDATSKALFDTGSPEYFTISPPDLEGARNSGGVDGAIPGNGSIGGSLGGLAPRKDQLMAQLNSLSIGNVQLGRVAAVLRESPPSLVGASVLKHFVVTLDAANSAAYFDQYRDGPFARPSYGFGLSFEEDVRVSLVWNNSPAGTAGLRVGQKIKAINGQTVSNSCTGIRQAMHAMSEGNSIEIELEDRKEALVLEKEMPD